MEHFRIAHLQRGYNIVIYGPLTFHFNNVTIQKQLWPKVGEVDIAPPAYVKETVAERARLEGIALMSPEWEIAVQKQRVRKIGRLTLRSAWKNIEIIDSSYINASQ
jgi:hypothetical protein